LHFIREWNICHSPHFKHVNKGAFHLIRPLEYQLSSSVPPSVRPSARILAAVHSVVVVRRRRAPFSFRYEAARWSPSQHCDTRSAVTAAEGRQPSAGARS
jgi:hypothetical protein